MVSELMAKDPVPTHVGMNLRVVGGSPGETPCPHARGDEPGVKMRLFFDPNLSPRTWG